MSRSRTERTVRRGPKDMWRSGAVAARGTGWLIARAVTLCGVAGGLVIIDAPGGLSSLFRLGPSAAAAQESPLGAEKGLPGGSEGARSLNSGEWRYAADGTTQVRAASKPPTTKITGDANWDDIAVTSRFEADANYTVARQTGRAVMSIASLVAGIAALGFGVAGIAIAIVEPASGRVEEGRSAAGWPYPVVMCAEGVLHAGTERWGPRGKAWVCRSWCEEGTSACIEVCGPPSP